MKRLSTIIMALVLALGLTQCKKNEQPTTENQGETYNITLNVKGASTSSATGNAKVDVNTITGSVNFETGDKIHVASAGKYVGMLTYNGTVFTGAIGNATEGQPLQFYFLGNVDPAETLSIGTSESCSVVISDQTQHLPVISAASSVENFYGEVTEYTAELKNKCALVKFNVTTSSAAPTCIAGFNNKVTIDFTENTITNSMEGDGAITLPAGNGEKWAILLPQESMTGGEAYASGDEYAGTFGAVPALYVNGYFPAGIPVEVTTFTHNYLIDLSTLTGDYQAINGDTLTGTLAGTNYNITVAEGATVTLWNAQINPNGDYLYSSSGINAGINCQNNVTILIEGTNVVRSWTEQGPCIFIATGKTLTIDGNGSLQAVHPQGTSAAIGARMGYACGNIVINGGNITAQSTVSAAIGGGQNENANCGHITINGGSVNATVTSSGAAIGSGYGNNCEGITITGGTVVATARSGAGIGGGHSNVTGKTCGDILISGGNVTATSSYYGAGIGAGYYTNCGNITITGGTVNAQATGNGTGIGAGYNNVCGDILISGGNVTAIGSANSVGIGAAYAKPNSCGTITITNGVEQVTAKKGSQPVRSIGAGMSSQYATSTCGTVTIGGVEYAEGDDGNNGVVPNQADGLTYIYIP